MNVEEITQICQPGVPALAGGMPASTAAYCRERPIQLKPGIPSRDVRIECSTFISASLRLRMAVHRMHPTSVYGCAWRCIECTLRVSTVAHDGASNAPYECLRLRMAVHRMHPTSVYWHAAEAEARCIECTLRVSTVAHGGASNAPYECLSW
jgi:hypothetical protein